MGYGTTAIIPFRCRPKHTVTAWWVGMSLVASEHASSGEECLEKYQNLSKLTLRSS